MAERKTAIEKVGKAGASVSLDKSNVFVGGLLMNPEASQAVQVVAQERTKQEVERTQQAAHLSKQSKHATVRHVVSGAATMIGAGLIAAVPSAGWPIALVLAAVLGVSNAGDIIRQITAIRRFDHSKDKSAGDEPSR